eukprot:PRCOL_00004427-RA
MRSGAGGRAGMSSLARLAIDATELDERERVGGGAYSTVHRAMWLSTPVAVKRFFGAGADDAAAARAEFDDELLALRDLRHPHVVQLLGAVTEPPSELRLVFEYLPKSLHEVLHASQIDVDRKRIKEVGSDICRALAYLHNRQPAVVHQDLKPANVLVDRAWRCKLADFGLASGKKRGAGTPAYMAPEMFSQGVAASPASDVYALGMVLWELVARQCPWDGVEPADIKTRVCAGERPPQPLSCPRELRDIIETCAAHTPGERPTALEVLAALRNSAPAATMGMEKYVVDRRIGVGSYGSAYLVRLRADKQRCLVLKKIRLDNVGAKERRAAHAEAKLLQRFDHPFVLGYVDSFSHKGHLCIVTDYCEAGDLYCRLKSSKSYWREDAILDMFAQICLALDYVHDQKVLHRDLKTQNVFLHRNGTIKLGDFGIARQMDAPMDMAMTVIGTPYYMSPELMEGKAYGYKSDVWALGCVLYELATLKHAFDANDMNGLVMKIVRGRVLPVPMHYSPELRALICKLLSKRSADRPTVKRVLETPVLAKHVAKHRAAVLARLQQVQVEKGAPPAAAAPAAGAASAAGGVVAKGRADARVRLERDLASQREARARLEGNMNRLAERNRKQAPVGGSKAPAHAG